MSFSRDPEEIARIQRNRLRVNVDAISGGKRTPRSPPEIAAIEPRDSQRAFGDFLRVAAKRDVVKPQVMPSHVSHQQILGNCSPLRTSTNRVPPTQVFMTTLFGWSSTTCPTSAAPDASG